MKKFILLSAALMLSLMLSAQTQQGYVKTKGRMDAKGNLIHGQGLKGATVSIKGRTTILVNAEDGSFSFPITEKQFRLDSVRKKGYQLVDMDALGKTYKHSSNPLYLVMETPEQQLQDQLAAERKIRRTLNDQLHQREDKIEALKKQQKISDEEYRQALQKLYEETDQNEQLVKDMVERYSKIDYDQLNESDQLISNYILNGELVKADSLLRTKGDINERVSQYKKHEAINAKEREELSQRQEQLEQSEALAIQERNDLANDCYRKFEIFKMQSRFDSAAYYIELRASLDEHNSQWSIDAGNFLGKEYHKRKCGGGMLSLYFYKKYWSRWHNYIPKIEYYEYYRRALETLENNKKAELLMHWGSSDISNNNDSIARNHLDSCYYYLHQYNSLDNDVCYSVLTGLGKCYYSLGEYDKALEFEKSALSFSQNAITNNIHLYENYWYIGLYYYNCKNYKQAIMNCEYAIDLLLEYYDEYDEFMWSYYYSMSNIFIDNKDIEKYQYYYEKSEIINQKKIESYDEVFEEYDKTLEKEAKEKAPKFGL